jgi:hypothetical protein
VRALSPSPSTPLRCVVSAVACSTLHRSSFAPSVTSNSRGFTITHNRPRQPPTTHRHATPPTAAHRLRLHLRHAHTHTHARTRTHTHTHTHATSTSTSTTPTGTDRHGCFRYLLAGVARRGDITEHRFVVVPEDKLAEAKGKFERITSEHVYSLQRSVPKDLPAALFQVTQPHTQQALSRHPCQPFASWNATTTTTCRTQPTTCRTQPTTCRTQPTTCRTQRPGIFWLIVVFFLHTRASCALARCQPSITIGETKHDTPSSPLALSLFTTCVHPVVRSLTQHELVVRTRTRTRRSTCRPPFRLQSATCGVPSNARRCSAARRSQKLPTQTMLTQGHLGHLRARGLRLACRRCGSREDSLSIVLIYSTCNFPNALAVARISPPTRASARSLTC